MKWWKATIAVMPMTAPMPTICRYSRPDKMAPPGSRGGCVICAGSRLSTPSASAGRPLVMRLIHKIWIGASGCSQPSSDVVSTNSTAPAFDDKRKKMNFLILA